MKAEFLYKSLLSLTKIIVTFLVIMLLIFSNYLDHVELKKNMQFLNLVSDVYKKGDDKLSFENFELERLNYLRAKNPLLATNHGNLRSNLVSIFKRFGLSINRQTKGEDDNPNRFILMECERLISNSYNNDSSYIASDEYYPRANNTYLHESYFENLDTALNFFNKYAINDTTNIVTNIDTTQLVSIFDSLLQVARDIEIPDSMLVGNEVIPNGRQGYPSDDEIVINQQGQLDSPVILSNRNKESLFSEFMPVNKIYLKGDSLYVDFYGRSTTGANSGATANELSLDKIAFPVKISKYKFPSTLFFANLDPLLVEQLANDHARQQYLSNAYGFYNLSSIDELIGESIKRNNSSVSILGFDVSRRWFPVAMFLTLAGVYTILYKFIKHATATSQKIITNSASSDIMDFLVNVLGARFFVWFVVPIVLVILVTASSLIIYSTGFQMLLLALSIYCASLGFLSFFYSRRL